MQQLKIDQEKARKLFPSAPTEFKEMLIDTFGKEFFEQKITDRVKTFQDACRVLSINPDDLFFAALSGSGGLEKDELSILAYCKLIIIARALNEGWLPDWTNINQCKYVPWFKNMSGVGLSCDGYVRWYSPTTVGSRLCYKSSELAEYAATQFADIYREFLTLD
jgi:hypothetical protein